MESPLSLSNNPNPGLIEAIDKNGGKLGSLQLIGQLRDENPEEFDATGILTGGNYVPTIIPPGQEISDTMWKNFEQQHSLTTAEKGTILVRASLPGDYRSLVDVIETYNLGHYGTSENHLREICRFMDDIRISVSTAIHIPRYAKDAGVPFDAEKLNFGLIPRFSDNLVIVTEHPNQPGQFIQEGPFKENDRNNLFDLHSGKYATMAQAFITLLRKKGILDSDIAYSLELGITPDGKNAILYQIRELCRKVPMKAAKNGCEVHGYYFRDYITTIINAIPDGESRIYKLRGISMECIDVDLDLGDETPYPYLIDLIVAGRRLQPRNHSNRIGAVLTGNYKVPGIGKHDNMRFIQFALQQGGIVFSGTEGSDGSLNFSGRECLRITNNNGVLDIKSV